MFNLSDRHLLFEQLPVAISLVREQDGVYADVNEEWTRLTGWAAQDVLGRSSLEVCIWRHDVMRPTVLPVPCQDSSLCDYPYALVTPDGRQILVSVNVSRLHVRGIAYLLTYFKDVTSEHTTRVALLESEQQLKASNERLSQQLELFEAMENLASVGYWTSENNGENPVLSKGMRQLTGLDAQLAMGDASVESRIVPEDLAGFQAARETLNGATVQYRWHHPDCHVHWLRSRMQRLSGDGAMGLNFGVVQDVTRERELVLTLQERLGFIQKVTSGLPGVVFQIRRNADNLVEFLYISETAHLIFPGLTDTDILQDAYCTLGLHHPDDLPAFRASVRVALDALTPWQHEYRLRLPDGSVRWLFGHGVPESDAQGAVLMSGFVTDISQRKLADAQIEQLAFYDVLTGLPNRRLLIERLQQALLSTARHGHFGALLFIDLDNFKDLNDTLGHDTGDQLLVQVAQRLRQSVREIDIVARLGGDEFVVVLEDIGSDIQIVTNHVAHVGQKLVSSLNQVYQIGEIEHHSTPSVGVAMLSRAIKSVDELLKQADLAMYESKAAGRNTLRFFDPAMQALVARRSTLTHDLRAGLKRSEFVLFYQPVVNRLAQVVGAEALVRWQHPTLGLLSPGEFIEQAEHGGLIVPLGQWVLLKACEQLVQWSMQPETADLTMAVNVSERQFCHPDFVTQVRTVLRATGAAPYLLKLEITESLLVTDMQDVVEKMSILRADGVSFSLDDFGTGYSSLSYLKRLPLDLLKIDKSLVKDVLTEPSDAAIAITVLSLGENLKLKVVAEGVEENGQWQFLLDHGCDLFQGYLFGKPVPIAQFPLGSLALCS